ncbi:MAG: metallophosphoesterase [Spirochaetaceae bacterium]|nr:MAG: metallophosphoesterase [Spirochaetaceae bacterium]
MKILCVSDHVDPLVYNTGVRERFSDIDLVIGAGDLPMEYLGFLASSLNTPVLFVFGNHNLSHIDNFRPRPSPAIEGSQVDFRFTNTFGSTYIHGRIIRAKGVLIAGLGGSLRYNAGENQFTDGQMYRQVLRMLPRLLWNRLFHGRYVDILVTHAAPYGVHDKPDRCHTGFRAFRWFIRRFRPRYLLHGHIHLYDLNARRVSVVDGTTVINVYSHYVLDTQEPPHPSEETTDEQHR